ncbi:hypothetical protein [Bacillus sp. S/N-304-OC-R1]|uniref:hypothetical protein n=1 Tax=Bacillus sp. S/N-304-OC-R1 TaxID=2758034 RepID=UPI001C8D680A|nr:hypothetical protein [Bacillus sp. S/N-304-OC-R1]MBY0123263.1 hypothetical protein [Bacillus sp. S/N-304-OC-R1]
MKRLFVIIMLLILAAGCNTNFNRGVEKLYGPNEKEDGFRNVSTRNDDAEYNTRAWTMDEQNPNFPNTPGTNRVTQQSDIEQARKVIDGMNGYRSGPVWINGDDMWVTAYKKGMLSDTERRKESKKVRDKLENALPRYHIEIKIQEDRR